MAQHPPLENTAFSLRDTKQVTATGCYKDNNRTEFYIPYCDNPYIIYKDRDKNHKFLFSKSRTANKLAEARKYSIRSPLEDVGT